MRKQNFDRIKKMTAILLVVLFVATVTAGAVSAIKPNTGSSSGASSSDDPNNVWDINWAEGSQSGQPDGQDDANAGNAAKFMDSGEKERNERIDAVAQFNKHDITIDQLASRAHNDGYEDGYVSGYANP